MPNGDANHHSRQESRIDAIEQAIVRLEGAVNTRMASVEGKIDMIGMSIAHAQSEAKHLVGGVEERLINVHATVHALQQLVERNNERITSLEAWRPPAEEALRSVAELQDWRANAAGQREGSTVWRAIAFSLTAFLLTAAGIVIGVLFSRA